jgi:hypothetical protein
VIVASIFRAIDDESSKHFYNVGKQIPVYTAQHSIRQPSSEFNFISKETSRFENIVLTRFVLMIVLFVM